MVELKIMRVVPTILEKQKKEDILNFVKSKLKIKHSNGEYHAFSELIFIFIGSDLKKKIFSPSIMH